MRTIILPYNHIIIESLVLAEVYMYGNFIVIQTIFDLIINNSEKNRMKKFYVLFCAKNTMRPKIYMTLKGVTNKTKQSPSYSFKSFQSQAEAEIFLSPKKIAYLRLKEEMQNTGKFNPRNQIQNLMNSEDLSSHQQPEEKGKSQIKQMLVGQMGIVSKPRKKKNLDDFLLQDEGQMQEIQVSGGSHIKDIGQTIYSRINSFEKKEIEKLEQSHLQKEESDHNQQDQGLFFDLISKRVKDESIKEYEKSKILLVYEQIMEMNQRLKSIRLNKVSQDDNFIAFFDGCSKPNPGLSGVGYILCTNSGKVVFENSINVGYKTNNQAQFLGLIYLLIDCKLNNIKNLKVLGDSKLVIQSMNNVYKVHHKNIIYLFKISKFISEVFNSLEFIHVERDKNKIADSLSLKGYTKAPFKKKYSHILSQPQQKYD